MALRGKGYPVGTSPALYKDLDPRESFFPAQVEFRNGRVTDASSWTRRPGMARLWETGVASPVTGLIPAGPGYAVHRNGQVVRLGETPVVLSGRLAGRGPASYVCPDEAILVATGGPITVIGRTGLRPILAGAPSARFLAMIGNRVVAAGQDRTQWHWSAPGNHLDWDDGDFANVSGDGEKLRNLVELRNQIYIIKDRSTEVWDLVGNAAAFNRTAVLSRGTIADYSVVKANDTIYMLGADGNFYVLDGRNPRVLSDSQQRYMQQMKRWDDCQGMHFEHENVIRWLFPSDGKCLTYDYARDYFVEDNAWINGGWAGLPIASMMVRGSKTYVGGSGHDGRVYVWSRDEPTDDGAPIRCFRSFSIRLGGGDTGSALRSGNTGYKGRCHRLQFRVARGAGRATPGSEPAFEARWRLDKGRWHGWKRFSLNEVGNEFPWISQSNVGVGRELELEIVETDPTDWIVTDINAVIEELGR